jgi:predicted histidine transporter YuiF (NhaC family)
MHYTYRLFVVLLLMIGTFLGKTTAQESINVHEGYNVPLQAGLSLAICYSILGSFAIMVNIIQKRCYPIPVYRH